MSILIVDDSESIKLLYRRHLRSEGFMDVELASSADEAFEHLKLEGPPETSPEVDLILMDLVMPGINGIEACRYIKASERYRDIPIIMVTSVDKVESLQKALESGATDYISKPVNKVELLARVRSALRLKEEMDKRKARERELEERNRLLERLSFLDGLTEIPNRRYFDESLPQEWKRASREGYPVALIMVDIDYFKLFNDLYGHQQGDHCLKSVAGALHCALKRPADFVARYGGEEFIAVLPNTDAQGAQTVAESMRTQVAELAIPHAHSTISDCVSISLGVVAAKSQPGSGPRELIDVVDEALYKAKRGGRNQVVLV